MPHFVFTHVSGYLFRHRALGFLRADGIPELDAQEVFEGLVPKDADLVRGRFGLWLEGKIYDKYFHGRGEPEYKHCFYFKWEKKRKPQRLYGFLCHPKPDTEKAFILCVLAYFDTKDDSTDLAILDRLNKLRQDLNVIAAISTEYPEFTGGQTKWKH